MSYVPGFPEDGTRSTGVWGLRSAGGGLVPQVGLLARAADLGEHERPGGEADDDSEELLH